MDRQFSLSFIPAMQSTVDTSPQLAERILVEKLREKSGSSRAELTRIFRQLDTSGNEQLLDLVEFSRCFRKLDIKGFSRDHVRYLFDKYDTDKSGSITPSEFIEGVEKSWSDLMRTESNLPVILIDTLLGTTTLGKDSIASFCSDESEVCGLSALCGALRTVIDRAFTPFCVFPELNLEHLLDHLKTLHSKKTQFASLLQKLTATALMLYCQVSENDRDGDQSNFAIANLERVWTIERMHALLALFSTFSDKVTFLFYSQDKGEIQNHVRKMALNRQTVQRIAMGLWSLALLKTTRGMLLEAGAMNAFLNAVKGFVNWFCKEAAKKKRRMVYPPFTIQKTHECLNIVLKPLLLLLGDLDFISNESNKESVEECIFLLVDVLKTVVLPHCSSSMGEKQRAQCLNEIGGKCLDAFWNLGQQELFDPVIFSEMSLLTIRDVSINVGIFPPLRKKAACILYSLFTRSKKSSRDNGADSKPPFSRIYCVVAAK